VKDIDDAFAGAQPGTGWGMTETNAIGTGIGGQDLIRRPEALDKPSEKQVADPRNRFQGQPGEEVLFGLVHGGLWIRRLRFLDVS
jgi:hypothetical protein